VTGTHLSSNSILVLDEVDALVPSKSCSASNQILRALFALPYHHAELDLKLIAIANSLDLTARKSVASILGAHAPSNLTFKAYGAKEMTDIIKRRVHDCNEALKTNCPDILPAFVDDKAIELVGRKVEANNGDLRMCLGVLVDAVNATEAEWRKKAASAGNIAPFKVSLTHVLKALSAYNKLKANAAATSSTSGATSGSSNLDNKVRSLNVQVRMILLAWLISKQRLKHGLRPAHVQAASASFGSNAGTTSTESISTEALYPTYTYVLSTAASPFPPASQPDFMDLLMQAEVIGLLSVEGGDGLTPSKSKARRGRAKERAVELLVKEEDLKMALGIKEDAEPESTIAMDSEIRAIWYREEKRWMSAVAGRQRAVDSARRHAENGTAGFDEAE
jgi:cell division control protein 6